MPFVKCLSGFAELWYQVPPWYGTSCPKNAPQKKSKEACLVPAPKARLYRKVLVAKCLPGCAEGPCQGQPLSPRKCFNTLLGTRLEGTFECKARLENAELFVDHWQLWRRMNYFTKYCDRKQLLRRHPCGIHPFPELPRFGLPN